MGGCGPLLSLRLSVDYPGKPGVLKDAALEVRRGEILALVGQSGSGKSTLALSILRLLGLPGGCVRGEVRFQNRDLLCLKEREIRSVRGRQIGLVPQSPISSLNPSLKIGKQMWEAWRAHSARDGIVWTRHLQEVLHRVSLPGDEQFLKRYPSELSVGLAQRVLIAQAILHRPPLLIADEPTSALDVITQAEILELFADLNREFGIGILYISHDLLSIASLCHRVAILHNGAIVETGSTETIFGSPQHPYTRRLIEALPRPPEAKRERESIRS